MPQPLFETMPLASRPCATALAGALEAAAHDLGCEQASVWLHAGDPHVVACIDLYSAALDRHTAARELPARHFERYADALASASDDARLEAAQLLVQGQRVGVLCLERAAAAAAFTPDERVEVAAIAGRVAAILEAATRRVAPPLALMPRPRVA